MLNSINNQQVNLPTTLQPSETHSVNSRIAQCSLSSAKNQSQESGSCYLIDCVKSILKAVFTCIKKFFCCCFCCYTSSNKSPEVLDLQKSEDPIADLLSLKNGSNIKEVTININKPGTVPAKFHFLFKLMLGTKTPNLEKLILTVSYAHSGLQNDGVEEDEEDDHGINLFELCPKLEAIVNHGIFEEDYETQTSFDAQVQNADALNQIVNSHSNPENIRELFFLKDQLNALDRKLLGKFPNLEKIHVIVPVEQNAENKEVILGACKNFKDLQTIITRD